jgi:glutamate-5-semialdehyde dehydrogenase
MSTSNELTEYSQYLGRKARDAGRRLATTTGKQRNHAILQASDALLQGEAEILEANARDLARASEFGLSSAQIDRLKLDSKRIAAMAEGLRTVAALPDPLGKVLEGSVRPNGLEIRKVTVPLGVLFFIYESRPNVTVDAAALALKSGNAIILRGGKEAMHSNQALHALLQRAFSAAGLPDDAVQLVDRADRQLVNELLSLSQYIDLAIPRGGEGLIRAVAESATMPVIKHFNGNCHVYIDESADLDMAERILINAKCQRPGVCNAAETLLVHQAVAERFVPRVIRALRAQGVEVRGCTESRRLVPDLILATDTDYATEYLDLILALRVVPSLDEAIEHINRFGSQHTDAIVTSELRSAHRFKAEVDSAAVMVNASTRFHDGFEFGLGAEIGISTDKFHARGPCGLLELTTYKWLVVGEGQIR